MVQDAPPSLDGEHLSLVIDAMPRIRAGLYCAAGPAFFFALESTKPAAPALTNLSIHVNPSGNLSDNGTHLISSSSLAEACDAGHKCAFPV